MIFLLIEVNGSKQLQIIDPGVMEQVTATIFNLLQTETQQQIQRLEDCYVFTYYPEKHELLPLFEQVYEVYAYLLSRKDDLRGFTLFLDYLSEVDQNSSIPAAEDTLKLFLSKLYHIVEDESFWIGEDGYELFKPFIKGEKKGDSWKVIDKQPYTFAEEKKLETFLQLTENVELFLDKATPFLHGKRKGFVYITGYPQSGLEYIVEQSMAALGGKDGEFPFIKFDASLQTAANSISFLGSLNSDLIRTALNELTSLEQKTWSFLEPLLNIPVYRIHESDQELLLKLFLTGWIRAMENNMLPPVLCIYRTDLLSDEELFFLERLMRDFLPSLLIIFTSYNADVPAQFQYYSVAKIEIPFLKGAVLKKWLSNSCFEQIDQSLLQKEYPALELFHTICLLGHKNRCYLGVDATKHLVNSLDKNQSAVLIALIFIGPLFPWSKIKKYLEEEGCTLLQADKCVKELLELGLFLPGSRPHSQFCQDWFLKWYKKHKSISYIQKTLLEWLDKQIHNTSEEKECCLDYYLLGELYHIFFEKHNKAYYYMLVHIQNMILWGKCKSGSYLLEQVNKELLECETKDEAVKLLLSMVYQEAALYECREDFADDLDIKIGYVNLEQFPFLEPEIYLLRAKYKFMCFDYRSALEYTKKGISKAQEHNNYKLEARSDILLGRIMLGMHRLEEGRTYFKLAQGVVKQDEFFLEAMLYEGITLFLQGNLAYALRLVEEGILLSEHIGHRFMHRFLLFFKGRILFEFGYYADAAIEFQHAMCVTRLYFHEEKQYVIQSWIGRCFIYQGYVLKGTKIIQNLPKTSTTLYYISEGSALFGEYEQALTLIEESLKLEKDRLYHFGIPDIFNWENGFDIIEDAALARAGGQGILLRLIIALRGYLLCRIGKTHEGYQDFHILTREENMASIDPYTRIYYLFHALSLPEEKGSESLDRLTVLNKGLRCLQDLASKIETPVMRQAFLTKNYWNSKLFAESKQYKLL